MMQTSDVKQEHCSPCRSQSRASNSPFHHPNPMTSFGVWSCVRGSRSQAIARAERREHKVVVRVESLDQSTPKVQRPKTWRCESCRPMRKGAGTHTPKSRATLMTRRGLIRRATSRKRPESRKPGISECQSGTVGFIGEADSS
jgi:hypothetical protein